MLLDDGEWAADTFDATLAAAVEGAARDALGHAAFDAAHAAGRVER